MGQRKIDWSALIKKWIDAGMPTITTFAKENGVSKSALHLRIKERHSDVMRLAVPEYSEPKDPGFTIVEPAKITIEFGPAKITVPISRAKETLQILGVL